MRARCYRCQHIFESHHYGTQKCPGCGQEVHIPDPSAPAVTSAPPGPAPGPSVQPRPGGIPGWAPPPPPGWVPTPPPPFAEQSSPFAERRTRGFFQSFVDTWKQATLEPARFFRQVRISEAGSAVLFGVIAFSVGTWGSLIFRRLTARSTFGYLHQMSERLGTEGGRAFMKMMEEPSPAAFLGELIVTPLIGIMAVYVMAAVIHVALLLVRGAPRGFDATTTVVGYSFGVYLISALPVCGGILAPLWFAVIAITGLAEAQRSGTGKATFAVMLPLLLGCLCACALTAAVGIAGYGVLNNVLNTPAPPTTGI